MAKSIKELQDFDKPREKLFERGAKALKDYELIAVMLGSGVKGKDVLQLSKEIEKLLKSEFENLDLEKLLEIKGLGIAKAATLLSAIELSKRYLLKQHKTISNASEAYEEFKDIADKRQEYFVALYLDGANRILEKRTLFIGTVNKSLVHPREVFAPAIELRAASLIVAHNHPSGELQPSQADIAITQKLTQSAEILGIDLLDHLIVAKEGYFSFEEDGLL